MQIIKLHQISKNFKSKQALKNINIEFQNNKINGLLGPNGSGKTTLFNIIYRVIHNRDTIRKQDKIRDYKGLT